MTHAQVQNKDGNFVSPSSATFKAAAAGADWSKAPGYYLVITDQPGKDAWPISGATFILMYKNQAKPDTAKEVLKFFDWAYGPEGDKLADALDYVPLPDSVTNQIRGTWKSQIKDASGKPVY
jgi:phosphate transport system substrate-binding protein